MPLRTKQAQITAQAAIDPSQAVEPLALFDSNGNPLDLSGSGFDQVAAVANVSTADASDLATAQALANQLKTTLNDLLTKMRTAGILAP